MLYEVITQQQVSDVDEYNLRYAFDWESSKLDVGANYRQTSVEVRATTTQQDLGSWGMSNPGDRNNFV